MTKIPFLTKVISGADNETPAIGRVLGIALFINVLLAIPAVIAAALWGRKVEPAVWFTFLGSLGVYVPLCVAAVVGLVSGTDFTEPKPNQPKGETAVDNG